MEDLRLSNALVLLFYGVDVQMHFNSNLLDLDCVFCYGYSLGALLLSTFFPNLSTGT